MVTNGKNFIEEYLFSEKLPKDKILIKNKGHLYFCENMLNTSTEEAEVPFYKTVEVKIHISKTKKEYLDIKLKLKWQHPLLP